MRPWLSCFLLAPLLAWADPPKSAASLPVLEVGTLSRYLDPVTNVDSLLLSLTNLGPSPGVFYNGLDLSFSVTATKVKEVRVGLFYRSAQWMECSSSLRVDGKKPTILGDSEESGAEHLTEDGSYFSSSYTITVSWAQLSRFLKAKQIEGKFCGMSFELTKEQLSAIAVYGEQLVSWRASLTVPKVPTGRLMRGQELKTGTPQLLLSLEKLSSKNKKYEHLGLLVQAYEVGAKEVALTLSDEPPSGGCENNSTLTADGEALTLLKDVELSSGTRSTDMDEHDYYLARRSLSREDFALFVKAKKIEGVFCGASFVLTKTQQEALVIYEKALLSVSK